MIHSNGAAVTASKRLQPEDHDQTTPQDKTNMQSDHTRNHLQNYISDKPIDALLTLPETLMVLPYSSGSRQSCAPSQPGVIHSGLTLLGTETTLNEVWSTIAPVIDRGISGNCHWSITDSILAAAIWLTPEACQNLESSSESAYLELLSFITDKGYPHPFRFWNYIPDINLGEGNAEHYKLFCTGRLKAFRTIGIPDDQFPSASALGHHSEGAVIYVLSAQVTGRHHNNALQVNAYQYPREHGLSSPSFSRATCINLDQQDLFFVSGTASIIGHKTTCEGDLSGQLNTTISNIKHLLDNKDKANNYAQLRTMKVYLRHASDFISAHQQLKQAFPDILTIFTLADICRDNLMVEVECFCG
jgi:chorismate lyase/3-hydroxybenzoate synthase